MKNNEIKKFTDILNENKTYKNDFGCLMVNIEFPGLTELHNNIKEDDIYNDPNDPTYGLEDDPHVTILFGFHEEVNPDDTITAIEKENVCGVPTTLLLSGPTMFSNEQYDVLKYDVLDHWPHTMNNIVKKFPHTNKFKDYHPHVTVAYLKPGKGKNYISDKKIPVVCTEVIFSPIEGDKSKYPLDKLYKKK